LELTCTSDAMEGWWRGGVCVVICTVSLWDRHRGGVNSAFLHYLPARSPILTPSPRCGIRRWCDTESATLWPAKYIRSRVQTDDDVARFRLPLPLVGGLWEGKEGGWGRRLRRRPTGGQGHFRVNNHRRCSPALHSTLPYPCTEHAHPLERWAISNPISIGGGKGEGAWGDDSCRRHQ
jgi:hypothetical protein